MQGKRHALTRLGEASSERRVHFRRDANCPVIAHARNREGESRIAVPCWMVNLSEEGCLLTSDHFPPRIIDIYLIIPGLGAKVHGVARTQGEYTVNVRFTAKLTADVINKVARIKTVARQASA
ncbi:hypothetical protein [Hoeflea sp.]|uniref:hypothetical protein n=1 Tax=Hoeflea sp. TaxID=1940281 RepID=UPI003BB01E95